jgi:hypothetical protein
MPLRNEGALWVHATEFKGLWSNRLIFFGICVSFVSAAEGFKAAFFCHLVGGFVHKCRSEVQIVTLNVTYSRQSTLKICRDLRPVGGQTPTVISNWRVEIPRA